MSIHSFASAWKRVSISPSVHWRRLADATGFVKNSSGTFGGADVALAPVMPIAVPDAAEADPASDRFQPRTLYALSRFTRFVNFLGLPAMSVPAGFDERGRPVGLQIIGQPCRTSSCCRLPRCSKTRRIGTAAYRQPLNVRSLKKVKQPHDTRSFRKRIVAAARSRFDCACARARPAVESSADFGADVIKIEAPPGVDPNEGMSGATRRLRHAEPAPKQTLYHDQPQDAARRRTLQAPCGLGGCGRRELPNEILCVPTS